MIEDDKKYIQDIVYDEGFDNAMVHYSNFEEIDDEDFHRLRQELLRARSEIMRYLEIVGVQ